MPSFSKKLLRERLNPDLRPLSTVIDLLSRLQVIRGQRKTWGFLAFARSAIAVEFGMNLFDCKPAAINHQGSRAHGRDRARAITGGEPTKKVDSYPLASQLQVGLCQ